jgi:hypothetical protein
MLSVDNTMSSADNMLSAYNIMLSADNMLSAYRVLSADIYQPIPVTLCYQLLKCY